MEENSNKNHNFSGKLVHSNTMNGNNIEKDSKNTSNEKNRSSSLTKAETDLNYQNYIQLKKELNNKKHLLRGMSPNINENKKSVNLLLYLIKHIIKNIESYYDENTVYKKEFIILIDLISK